MFRPTRPTARVSDGDVIDLGDRSLRVIHTPGHTPDCICLLDELSGILFGGDTINTGPIYAQLPDSDVASFARSTRRLAELASSVRVVYVPHFERYAVDSHFLVEVADGLEDAAAGRAEWFSATDYLGTHAREARFARFSILVAECDDDARP
jgi:glyoxylase-like metal-dependent hydrolase (beta-lactamase superfamily II)